MKINIFKDNFVDNVYADQKLANHTWFGVGGNAEVLYICLLYTSPSPRDKRQSRMPSSA